MDQFYCEKCLGKVKILVFLLSKFLRLNNYNWSQNNAFASWMLLLAKDTFVTPKLLEYFYSAIKFRSMAIILNGLRKAIFRLRPNGFNWHFDEPRATYYLLQRMTIILQRSNAASIIESLGPKTDLKEIFEL